MTQRDPSDLDGGELEITDLDLIDETEIETDLDDDLGDMEDEATGVFGVDAFPEDSTTVYDPHDEGALEDEGDAGDLEDEATRVYDPSAAGPALAAPSAPSAPSGVHVEMGAQAESPLAPRGPDPRAAAPPPATRAPSAAAAALAAEDTVVTGTVAPSSRPAVRQVATSAPRPRNNAPFIALAALLALALVVVLTQLGGSAVEEPASAPRATVAVFSSPAGASVLLDGEPLADVTPMSLEGIEPGRTYEIELRLDGHDPLVDTVRVETAGMESREFALAPVTGAMVIRTFPEGAEIAVDGTPRGPGPLTLDEVDRSRAYVVRATMEGYAPANRTVRWEEESPAQLPVVLTLEPILAVDDVLDEEAEAAGDAEDVAPPARATGAATRRAPPRASAASTRSTPPARSAPPARSTQGSSTSQAEDARARHLPPASSGARPSQRPSERAAAPPASSPPPASPPPASPPAAPVGEGSISVQALPYAQVYVNGSMVAAETPMLNHRLTTGVHTVKVFYVALQEWSDERTVRVDAGASRTLTFRATTP